MALTNKEDEYMYTALSMNYDFNVITLKTLGPHGPKRSSFLPELGRRLTITSEDPRETAFLF